jgi:hypothetical protein
MTLRLLVVLSAAHAALLTGMKVFDTHGSSQQMCAQKVLDDLDDTKDLSFAMIQDACVRRPSPVKFLPFFATSSTTMVSSL